MICVLGAQKRGIVQFQASENLCVNIEGEIGIVS